MDASLKTQFDIKNNVEDLQRYIAELKTWESEIKEKEQSITGSSAGTTQKMAPPRNKKPKQEIASDNASKQNKIAGNDYKAWDKFDVEKACRDIDGTAEESQNDTSSDDECDLPPVNGEIRKQPSKVLEEEKQKSNKDDETEKLKNIDLAFFEKEVGNKLVRAEKWKEAIECYSKAIKLDPPNQIYYANRALCHIKLSNFKVAEVDCTIALQIDKTYVKAYQRRAFARKALQQYEEAKSDYEQILLLEPKNALARVEIDRINDYLLKLKESGKAVVAAQPTFDHKKMFSTDSQSKKAIVKEKQVLKPKATPIVKKEDIIIADDKVFTTEISKDSVVVEPIKKLPHQRSKCPLKKIAIKQVDTFSGLDDLISSKEDSVIKKGLTAASPNTPTAEKAAPTGIDKLIAYAKATEIQKDISSVSPAHPLAEVDCKSQETLPPVPDTSVQFESSWKSLKGNDELCYRFLKSIPTKSLKSIFGSCLESWLLSQMLSILALDVSMKDATFQYEFLLGLTKIERFTSLALFLSPTDQQGLLKCCDNLSHHYSSEEIANLQKLYDL